MGPCDEYQDAAGLQLGSLKAAWGWGPESAGSGMTYTALVHHEVLGFSFPPSGQYGHIMPNPELRNQQLAEGWVLAGVSGFREH